MPQKNSRTSMDMLRDLTTIRSGKMPDGSHAKEEPEKTDDPVEERRERLAERRKRGELKDVNLPAR